MKTASTTLSRREMLVLAGLPLLAGLVAPAQAIAQSPKTLISFSQNDKDVMERLASLPPEQCINWLRLNGVKVIACIKSQDTKHVIQNGILGSDRAAASIFGQVVQKDQETMDKDKNLNWGKLMGRFISADQKALEGLTTGQRPLAGSPVILLSETASSLTIAHEAGHWLIDRTRKDRHATRLVNGLEMIPFELAAEKLKLIISDGQKVEVNPEKYFEDFTRASLVMTQGAIEEIRLTKLFIVERKKLHLSPEQLSSQMKYCAASMNAALSTIRQSIKASSDLLDAITSPLTSDQAEKMAIVGRELISLANLLKEEALWFTNLVEKGAFS